MSHSTGRGPRSVILAALVSAGAVAAVAYALWPQRVTVPPEPAEQPAPPNAVPSHPLPDVGAPLEEWIRTSNLLMDEGQYEAAIAGYTHALHLDSQNVSLWVDRGACRHATGDLVGAEADFRKALSLTPEHATAHYNLGIVHYTLGHADSARLHFNFVIQAAPGSPEAERARALIKTLP